MGTGLGPESYAIIEQGRIGQILSSRPQDRRADHRRGRRHQQIQNAQAPGGSETRERAAESGARVRHPGRSHAPAQFAQAPGVQDAALRRAESRDGCEAAPGAGRASSGSSSAKRPRRRSISTWLPPNCARSPKTSPPTSRNASACRTPCYETEARLTELRAELAALQVEAERTRGRLEAQVRETGAIEERIAQGEREVQELEARSGAARGRARCARRRGRRNSIARSPARASA